MKWWHHGCSGAHPGKLRWFFCWLQLAFHQTFKVCWQNSWLCCVHGNTLLFVSFHCWRLRQVDYSKSASRFLLLSKPLTVDSYFITYHMFNLHEETEQQKFKCCLQSHSVLALDRKMKHLLILFLGLKILQKLKSFLVSIAKGICFQFGVWAPS